MNRLTVLAVGGRLKGWAREAEREYCKRLSAWRAQVITVRSASGPHAKRKEAERMLAKVPAGSTAVACVAGASGPDSEELARRLSSWIGDGGVTFLVGGHHGLGEEAQDAARERLSLSMLTLAQDVARVVLLEQCYRSMCILSGHPYHAGPEG